MNITEKDFPLQRMLEEGDNIKIGKLQLLVKNNYIKNLKGKNSAIFKEADIDSPYTFCEYYYGYDPFEGDFPEYNQGDFNKATTVMNALFNRLQELGKVKGRQAVKIWTEGNYTFFSVNKETLKVEGTPLYTIELKEDK